jgi:anti-sigma-K factor RskA
MTIRLENADRRDPELAALLAREYAAPAGDSCWEALQQRVMQRIAREGTREWWSYFPEWTRIGLAAAAIALAVAGVAAWQSQRARERVAYRELLDTPSELPIIIESLGETSTPKRRDATLRYLISY